MHGSTHVGRALHVGVAAQCVDTAAGDANVAKQKLHDAHDAAVLRAIGVLRLAKRVKDRTGLVGAARGSIGLPDLKEHVMVHASDAFDHFGRIAGVVSLHDIQNAARILQRFIALEHLEFRRAGLVDPGKSRAFGRVPQLLLIGVVTPGFVVVLLLDRIPAREEARIGIELVVVAKQAGSVRVAEDIVLVIALVLQDVVDHPAEERNVGPRTQTAVDIGLSC